jgi:hypothetical protein
MAGGDGDPRAPIGRRVDDPNHRAWLDSLPRGPFKNDDLDQPRPHQERKLPGRRATDIDFREVASRRLVILTVVVTDALYLAGTAILFGPPGC